MTKLTLSNPTDVHNFMRGAPVHMTHNTAAYVDGPLTPFGCLSFRSMTRRERLAGWLRHSWLSATRWWRPRTVVVAIDHRLGGVTVGDERWSWRRWRWERMP